MPAPLPLAAARGWRKVVGHGQGGQAWTSRGPHVHLSTWSSPVSPSPWASGKALSLCPRPHCPSFTEWESSEVLSAVRSIRSMSRSRRGAGRRGEGASPAILVPGLDLRVGEVERSCELHAVLHAQVLLPLEAALQLCQLVIGEGRARLAWLFQAHWGAVPGAGDLPVALLLHCGDTAAHQGPASPPSCPSRRPSPSCKCISRCRWPRCTRARGAAAKLLRAEPSQPPDRGGSTPPGRSNPKPRESSSRLPHCAGAPWRD